MNGLSSAGRFIAHLISLKEDKAAMSALKRGAAHQPGEYPPQYRYIIPYIPQDVKDFPYFLTATLFAMHQDHADSGNFGSAFQKLYRETGSDSIELRFNALLQCREEDLSYNLRNAVSLLSSKSIRINFVDLFDSIRQWSHPDKFVQKKWAKEFWSPVKISAETTE